MEREIFINSYTKRDGTHVREHYRTINSDGLVDNSTHNGPVFSEYENGWGDVMYMGATPVLQGGVTLNTFPLGKIGEIVGEVLSTVIEVGEKLLPIASKIYSAIDANNSVALQNLKPQFDEKVKMLESQVEQIKQHNDATIQNLINIKDQTEYSKKYKEFMEDYALYKSTKNLVNGLKINAQSGNYEKMMQDIKGYAQDWGGEGAIIAKAQPISQYEKYLNKMYEETGNVFNAAATNMSTTSSMSNNVQKYKEIEPIGYEEIKPVEYKEIKVEGTTDKKLDDGKWIMPCKGKIVGHYGEVRPTHIHNGIDIAVPVGTPVKAVADGVVCAVGPAKGYGYWVVINHGKIGGTDVTSEYGHLSSWSVKHGQFVKKGDIIAKSGNTGRSYGPHVHITIREGAFQGRPVSPDKYIKY